MNSDGKNEKRSYSYLENSDDKILFISCVRGFIKK